MLNNTAYSRNELTREVNRYMTWPGQACAYKVGELKLKELRQKASVEMGSSIRLEHLFKTCALFVYRTVFKQLQM